MRALLLLAATLCASLAGCVHPTHDALLAAPQPAPPGADATGEHWTRLHGERWSSGAGISLPLPCSDPGPPTGWQDERDGAMVRNGTTHIVALLTLDGVTRDGLAAGFRFAYSIDGKEPTWSAAFRNGTHRLDIPVQPDEVEADDYRWAFGGVFVANGNDTCASGSTIKASFQFDIYAVASGPATAEELNDNLTPIGWRAQTVDSVLSCTADGLPLDPSYEFERGPEPVAPGTRHLVANVTLQGVWEKAQFGYSIDGQPPVWLPAFSSGTQAFDIPVAPGQEEATVFRWDFVFRVSATDLPNACSPGVAEGIIHVDTRAER